MRSEGTGQHLCNANLSGKVTTHKKKNEEKCMYQTEVNSRKKKKKGPLRRMFRKDWSLTDEKSFQDQK